MEPIECPECEEGFMVQQSNGRIFTCDTCGFVEVAL